MKFFVHLAKLTLVVLCSLLLLGAGITTVQAQVDRVEKGNLVIEGIPEIPERIETRLQQYNNTRSAGLSGWLPGGDGMIIATRFGEVSQLHVVEMPGGARQQITFFK